MPDEPLTTTLVLGASGFLGTALAAALSTGTALLTHHRHAQPASVFFDARGGSVRDLVSGLSVRPRAAVIALGIVAIDECARHPEATAEVNVAGIVRVIDELRDLGILPVFVSTDGVFDGSRGHWHEQDDPRPVLEYGRQKVAVERHLAAGGSPWLLVRLPKLVVAGFHPQCILSGWAGALGQPGRILCATDQYFTPACVADVARAIVLLIGAGAQGIYHLGGPQRLSRRELLAMVQTEFERHATVRATVQDCLLRDVPVLELRPLDTSMDSSRFAAAFPFRFRDMAGVARDAVRAHFSAQAAGVPH